MTLLSISILIVLIIINALYVAAEFAAVSVSRTRIQQSADEGDAAAKRLLPILSDVKSLDQYVAACQIGITLSSLILGAYGQVTLSQALAPVLTNVGGMEELSAVGAAAVIVLIFLTAFQMLLGELLPKSVALQFPTKVVLATTTPMLISLRLFHPFIQLLNGSGLLLMKLFRVPQTSHRHVHSAEEMGMLFTESHEGGLIKAEEHERLEHALQLENRKVSEIMVPRNQVRALDIQSSYETILQAMADQPFTRWPVYEGSVDNIIGIVHARDVAKLALDRTKKFSLRKVIRSPLVVHEGMTADDLLAVMRVEHKQLAIVVDEFGSTVGLVGISDVLDEFMGDIHEGPTTDESGVETLPDGRIRLPGSLRLEEAAKWIGREWTSESAITVAGKILEELGALPHVGDTFEIEGTRGEIEKVNIRAIESILVRPVTPDPIEAAEERHE